MKQDASVRRIHPALPVFRIDALERVFIYIPGRRIDVSPEEADRLERFWADPVSLPQEPSVLGIAAAIDGPARDVVRMARQWLEEPFMPECLTVYLSNDCNLQCRYCFSADRRERMERRGAGRRPVVNKTAAFAAARLVARNCAAKGKPFVLVLQGGGEPTVHWGLVSDIVGRTRASARQHGIPWFGYIATNGVMTENHALWLGRHFDVVGLSCDGPPEIQDRQRGGPGGQRSSPFVERTARLVKEAGGQLEVRATVTPETVERQEEIVSYIYRTLSPAAVRLEPVYGGRREDGRLFAGRDADCFVACFLAAQELAASFGGALTLSGIRPGEIHGPYCDVLRHVLRLTPDGAATGCFYSMGGSDPTDRQLKIGGMDMSAGEFYLDSDKIDALKRKAGSIPGACRECINIYSCSRSCPDACPVLNRIGDGFSIPPDPKRDSAEFRCLVHRKLALAWLLRSV